MLHLRFKRAARLLRGLMAFKELLSQSMLIRLGLALLVQRQLLPYLRSSLTCLPVAAARAEAVVPSLPAEWFHEGAAPAEAAPLIDLLSGMARSLEASRGESDGIERGSVARRLVPLLAHVGQKTRSLQLAQAFGLSR